MPPDSTSRPPDPGSRTPAQTPRAAAHPENGMEIETSQGPIATPQPASSMEDKLLAVLLDCSKNRDANNCVVIQDSLFGLITALVESMKSMRSSIARVEDSVARLEKRSLAPAPAPATAPRLPAKPASSWAAAASAGATQRTTTLPRPADTASTQVVNEFKTSKTVIRCPDNTDPCAGLDSDTLTNKINGILTGIKATLPDGTNVRILGANRLKSGDLIVHAKSRQITRWLSENRQEWTEKIHKDFITANPYFPVLIQAVPGTQLPGTEVFIHKLTNQNRSLPASAIHSTRWLVKPQPDREGSVLIQFIDKDLAAKVSKGSLLLDGRCLRGRPFKSAQSLCFNCQGIGHIASRCHRLDSVCGRCSGAHKTSDCPEPESVRCARCIHQASKKGTVPVDVDDPMFAHSPHSLKACPLRRKRISPVVAFIQDPPCNE